MKYKCHFCTQCGQCGQFSAPTAPSAEILLTEFFFICIWTTFITCIFFKNGYFLKKYWKNPSSYIVREWLFAILTYSTTYRVSNYRVGLLYALVCKGHTCHILFSYIIMKYRHETNCWSWFWVYKPDQKWKILNIQKNYFFAIFLKIMPWYAKNMHVTYFFRT